MANITLMSWNIETFGPKKFVDVKKGAWNQNAQQLVKMITATAHMYGANMIAIYEVAPAISAPLKSNLKLALNKQFKKTAWQHWVVPSNRSDHYLLLYRDDKGFRPYNPGGGVQAGLISDDVNGAALQFHRPRQRSGGRKPAYFIFETSDRNPNPEVQFSVVCYHAMMSPTYGSVGLDSLARGRQVFQTTAGLALGASIIAGDFNVDMVTDPGDYTDLIGIPAVVAISPAVLGNAAKSSLKNTLPNGATGSLDYRKSAYDNILVRNGAGLPANAQVIDGVREVCNNYISPGWLSVYTEGFDLEAIKHSEDINSLPPRTLDEAWCFFRRAISNHLPVVATITI